MKFKKHILFVVVFVCQNGIAKSTDTSIIKLGDGEIELSQKIDAESWKKAKYTNKNISFDFVLKDPDRSFFVPYNAGVGTYYKFDIAPLGRAADFQCFYIDMTNGCITKESYGNDCADNGSETATDLDSRVKATITNADFQQLKLLNGDRTEKVCGVTLDGNHNVKITKPSIIASDAKKTISFQEILNTCKTECNKNDLVGVDTKAITNIPKTQIATMNDIAFYMWKSSFYSGAIDLLNQVILADPERTPAYLNLGDALWDSNAKVEAIKNYGIYMQKMKQSGKENKIPERVCVRMTAK